MIATQPLTFFVQRLYRSNQELLLSSVADLDEDALRWRPARTNSIGFNLWHCARWADHLASILGEATPALRGRVGPRAEIWASERLSERWGFPSDHLGHVETGMGMDEDLSARLPLPAKDALVDYARRAFALAQATVNGVDESDYLSKMDVPLSRVTWLAGEDQLGQVVGWIMSYARHDARHLGMIEAVKGALGMRGTASV
jgi:hypothetical protein